MTLDEFLGRLREEAPKHRWRIDRGQIRSDCGCPIEVVAGTGDDSVSLACQLLRMPRTLQGQIVSAADGPKPHLYPYPYENGHLMGNHARLRHEMLRICGLV